MSKDDQYACVAHLGFVLHQRSQEENNGNANNENTTSKDTDVPSRFLLREIERFLKDGGIIKEVADQRKEAERFLELMQVEAGLIVERGTGENDETLYGFVHRTFQEYFAAIDVYKRGVEEERPEIINDFLVQHLHDPHWQEVILLLLGKLVRKTLTVRLQQILDGKIVSHRSQHTGILQQDLFFISTCLEEELVVEHLVTQVKTSPFSSQRDDALEHLSTLLRSRQYGAIAQKALMWMVTKEMTLDIQIMIDILIILYVNSNSKAKEQITQLATDILQHPNIAQKQILQATLSHYESSDIKSEEEFFAASLLMILIQRPDFVMEHTIPAAESLYRISDEGSKESRFITSLLTSLAYNPNLTFEQTLEVTEVLYQYSEADSEEKLFAISLLMNLAQRSDLAFVQTLQTALSLYRSSFRDSEERRFATTLLLQLAQRTDLSIDQLVQVGQALYRSSFDDLEERSFAATLLLSLTKRSDLPIEQMMQVGQALYQSDPFNLGERRFATTLLLSLAKRTDLSVEQTVQVGQALYKSINQDSEERRFATTLLLSLAKQTDLSVEQMVQVGQALYRSSFDDSEEKRFAGALLLSLVKRPDLSVEQSLRIAQAFDHSWSAIDLRRVPAQLYVSLIQQEQLAIEERDGAYESLRDLVPQFDTLLMG